MIDTRRRIPALQERQGVSALLFTDDRYCGATALVATIPPPPARSAVTADPAPTGIFGLIALQTGQAERLGFRGR
jgi:hypothetical protein